MEPISLQKVETEYCPICDVPVCYCKFIGLHSEEQTIGTIIDPNSKQNQKKKNSDQISIVIKNRNKRKHTTTIKGLEFFKVDPKELSKLLSKKLAMGCSSQKKNGLTQIVIQGEAGKEVKEYLISNFSVPQNLINITRKTSKPIDNPEENE